MTIDIDKLKEFGDGVISRAKTDITLEGCVAPVLVVIKNGGEQVETLDVPMANDEEMARVEGLLKGKASEHGTEALVFFMDSRIKDLEDNEPVPQTLEGDAEASDALYLAIYLPTATYIRQVLYSRDSDGSPVFMDIGWEDDVSGEEGFMANPWIKKGGEPCLK